MWDQRFDEEHNLWEVSFVNSQGAEHILNWELMSSPEARQLISKYKQIEENLEPPFIVEVVPKVAKEKAKEKDEELAEGEELEADKTTKPGPGSSWRRNPSRNRLRANSSST